MRSVVNLGNGDAQPCCRLCIYAQAIPEMEEKCLCSKKGMVTSDFYCKKFSLDIMTKTGRRRHSLGKRYSASEFSLHEDEE